MSTSKIVISQATTEALMSLARDIGLAKGSPVAVGDLADLLLREKLREFPPQRTVLETLTKQGQAAGVPRAPRLVDEAEELAAELMSQVTHLGASSVGPREEDWVQDVYPIHPTQHAAHASEGRETANPSTPRQAAAPLAGESSNGKPHYYENANPPGYYPGFPQGVLQMALEDPFIQPAPNAHYRPDYKVITLTDQGKRFLQFTGWRQIPRKDNHGRVMRIGSDGKEYVAAYRSGRMFPDRTGKKSKIAGTKVLVGDGSDGETHIE